MTTSELYELVRHHLEQLGYQINLRKTSIMFSAERLAEDLMHSRLVVHLGEYLFRITIDSRTINVIDLQRSSSSAIDADRTLSRIELINPRCLELLEQFLKELASQLLDPNSDYWNP